MCYGFKKFLNIFAEQVFNTVFLVKLLDRQIPTHTSEIRKHILNQLKALSAPAITSPPIDSSGENLQTGQYNPKCPRGQKGAKGKNGIDGRKLFL